MVFNPKPGSRVDLMRLSSLALITPPLRSCASVEGKSTNRHYGVCTWIIHFCKLLQLHCYNLVLQNSSRKIILSLWSSYLHHFKDLYVAYLLSCNSKFCTQLFCLFYDSFSISEMESWPAFVPLPGSILVSLSSLLGCVTIDSTFFSVSLCLYWLLDRLMPIFWTCVCFWWRRRSFGDPIIWRTERVLPFSRKHSTSPAHLNTSFGLFRGLSRSHVRCNYVIALLSWDIISSSLPSIPFGPVWIVNHLKYLL